MASVVHFHALMKWCCGYCKGSRAGHRITKWPKDEVLKIFHQKWQLQKNAKADLHKRFPQIPASHETLKLQFEPQNFWPVSAQINFIANEKEKTGVFFSL